MRPGDFRAAYQQTGSETIVADANFPEGYAVKGIMNATSRALRAIWVDSPPPSQSRTVWFGGRLKVTRNTMGASEWVAPLELNGSDMNTPPYARLRFDSNGDVRIQLRPTGTTESMSGVLSSWQLNVKADWEIGVYQLANGNFAADLYKNGVFQGTFEHTGGGTWSIVRMVNFGANYGSADKGGQMDILCSLVICTDSEGTVFNTRPFAIPNLRDRVLLPVCDALYREWTADTGEIGSYSRYDDALTFWDPNTYNGATAAGQRQDGHYAELPDVPETIGGVSLFARFSVTAPFLRIVDDGVTATQRTIFENISQGHWALRPSTNTAWTPDAVNRLIGGVQASGTTDRVSAHYAVAWCAGASSPAPRRAYGSVV